MCIKMFDQVATKFQIDIFTITLIMLIILFAVSTIMNLMQQRTKPVRERINTYTLITCVNGDHEERRDFVPGDYVGKVLSNKTCPKCESSLYIKSIYSEKIQEKK